jgi:putative transposase
VPAGLKRYYGQQHLHFITSSCYQRRPFLKTPESRNIFLAALERFRRLYCFDVLGYVVMPEHFHLLISEPERGDPSKVMQVLKQNVAKRTCVDAERLWQKRFYDFNVVTRKKMIEKIKYIHRDPVMRGLVTSPELWEWSSYRTYAFGEPGQVLVTRY